MPRSMIIGRSSGLWKTGGTPLWLTFVREGQFVADASRAARAVGPLEPVACEGVERVVQRLTCSQRRSISAATSVGGHVVARRPPCWAVRFGADAGRVRDVSPPQRPNGIRHKRTGLGCLSHSPVRFSPRPPLVGVGRPRIGKLVKQGSRPRRGWPPPRAGGAIDDLMTVPRSRPG